MKTFRLVLPLTIAFTLTSCMVDGEETSFNETDIRSGLNNSCSEISDIQECSDDSNCQILFEDDGDTFRGCIGIPLENNDDDIAEEEQNQNDDPTYDDDYANNNDEGVENDDSAAEDMSNMHQCQNKKNKVVVCHFPPGNHSNAKSLCVSKNAWINGLSNKTHELNYLGACKAEDL